MEAENGNAITMQLCSNNVPVDRCVTFLNKKLILANLTIQKADKNSGALLRGATFELRSIASNKTVVSAIGDSLVQNTDEKNGRALFENLSAGYYELEETQAPDGYVITKEKILYFKVTEEGKIQILEKRRMQHLKIGKKELFRRMD